MTTPVTEGQIGRFLEIFGAYLRKHREEFPSATFQQALGQAELVPECAVPLRERVNEISEMVLEEVTVDRKRTPRKALEATGRTLYVDQSAVDAIPPGEGEKVKICFFPLKRRVSDEELAKELAKRRLKPDPRAQAAYNEAHPEFADKHPNGVSWQVDGVWYFVTFYRWGGRRKVDCNQYYHDWNDYWWFAGVPVGE